TPPSSISARIDSRVSCLGCREEPKRAGAGKTLPARCLSPTPDTRLGLLPRRGFWHSPSGSHGGTLMLETTPAIAPGPAGPDRAPYAGAVLGLFLALAWEFVYILVGPNLREVVPGFLYRSSQPDRDLLAEVQRRHGVRSVLALRGLCESEPWFGEELR